MSHDIGERMTDEAVASLLGDGGIGVLGLAEAGEAYTFPIAFAYDEAGERCLFRFVSGMESRKQSVLPSTERASFTVYEWHDPTDWSSVVVNGPLEPLPEDAIAHAAGLFSDVGAKAGLEVFNRPLSAYDTEWYQLTVSEVIGRQAP